VKESLGGRTDWPDVVQGIREGVEGVGCSWGGSWYGTANGTGGGYDVLTIKRAIRRGERVGGGRRREMEKFPFCAQMEGGLGLLMGK